jgi:ribonuclease HI
MSKHHLSIPANLKAIRANVASQAEALLRQVGSLNLPTPDAIVAALHDAVAAHLAAMPVADRRDIATLYTIAKIDQAISRRQCAVPPEKQAEVLQQIVDTTLTASEEETTRVATEHIMLTAAGLLGAPKRSAAAKKAAETRRINAAKARANAMWTDLCADFAETGRPLDPSIVEDEAQPVAAPEPPKPQSQVVVASFDGACEPHNPGGHMGMGWVIDGQSHHRYIPAASGNTNNVAEYLALIEILKHAIESENITSLRITGDSQLVINQLNGEYAVRSANLIDDFSSAREMVQILRDRGCSVTITWHPRDSNAVADAASITALIENGVQPVDRVKKAKPDFARGRDYFRQRNVEYLTRAQLKERGWKLSKIEKLLDPPDVVETFKVRKRKCATYLYDASRVMAAEQVALLYFLIIQIF